MRQAICEADFTLDRNLKISVTVSVGVTEFIANDLDADLYSRADMALYAAKRQGRNRVCIQSAMEFNQPFAFS